MRRTDKFATEEELGELKKLAETARNTPVIAMSMAHGINHGGFAGEARTRMMERIHAIALSHGLPEVQGWYGVDLSSGEFLEASA